MNLTLTLHVLIPTLVELLAESIRENVSNGRGLLAYVVRVVPLINHEAWQTWRKEPLVAEILTFCDFLFNTGHRGRYMDGILPLTLPDLIIADAPDPRCAIEIADIHRTRTEKAKLLDNDTSVCGNVVKLGVTHPAVTYLFSESISLMQKRFRLHARYGSHFVECQREGCSRPAVIKSKTNIDLLEECNSSASEYWKCCRDGRSTPPPSSLPNDMSFCCYGCYHATNSEFKKVVKFDIVTPPSQTRNGAPTTPSRLYFAAVKRNVNIARMLSKHESVQTKHYPSTMANREKMVREQKLMLSVDLGLLYVASIVHELSPRTWNRSGVGKLALGDNWRDCANFHFSSVCAVRTIYLKYGNGILSRGGTEMWLRRLRDKALEIF